MVNALQIDEFSCFETTPIDIEHLVVLAPNLIELQEVSY